MERERTRWREREKVKWSEHEGTVNRQQGTERKRKSEQKDRGLNGERNICDRISGEQWRHFRVIRLIPHPL